MFVCMFMCLFATFLALASGEPGKVRERIVHNQSSPNEVSPNKMFRQQKKKIRLENKKMNQNNKKKKKVL